MTQEGKILGWTLGVIGGLTCAVGGAYLLSLKEATLPALVTGIGIYCVGKGMAVLSSTVFSARGAIEPKKKAT